MWWRLLGDAYLHIRHHCVDVGIIVAVLKDPHCAHQPKLTAEQHSILHVCGGYCWYVSAYCPVSLRAFSARYTRLRPAQQLGNHAID